MPSPVGAVRREGRWPLTKQSHPARAILRGALPVALGALALVTGAAPAWADDAGVDGALPDGGQPGDASTSVSVDAASDGGSSDSPYRVAVGAEGAATKAPPPVDETRVIAHAPVTLPREDRAAVATVLRPADSPRALDDLGALLLEVAGANVVRRGGLGSFTTVSLRGSNPDEVRVYVDGIPLNLAVGGAVDLSTLPLGDIERVEIYRGSTPIVFGESALGGVISITTRTPTLPRASARTGGGSFRTTFADVSAGTSLGFLKLYAGVHLLRALSDFPYNVDPVTGGYEAGTRQNNDLNQFDGVIRAMVRLPGRRDLGAGIIGLWRDQGLPAQDIYRATEARASTAHALANVSYDSRDDLGLNSRLRAIVFASQIWDSFSDPLHEIVGVATATHDRTRSLGSTVTASKTIGEGHRLTGVVEGRTEEYLPQNDLDPLMAAGYAATRQLGIAGVEFDAHSNWLNLDLIPSARLETSVDVRTGRSVLSGSNLPPSPATTRALPVLRMALLRPLAHGATLRANVGRYGRIPSFLELYGYNAGVLGNPTLRPERGLNGDLGVSIQRDRPPGNLTASASVFGARVEDLIAWEVYSYQTRAENIARASNLGPGARGSCPTAPAGRGHAGHPDGRARPQRHRSQPRPADPAPSSLSRLRAHRVAATHQTVRSCGRCLCRSGRHRRQQLDGQRPPSPSLAVRSRDGDRARTPRPPAARQRPQPHRLTCAGRSWLSTSWSIVLCHAGMVRRGI